MPGDRVEVDIFMTVPVSRPLTNSLPVRSVRRARAGLAAEMVESEVMVSSSATGLGKMVKPVVVEGMGIT